MIPGVIKSNYSKMRSEGHNTISLLPPFSNTIITPKKLSASDGNRSCLKHDQPTPSFHWVPLHLTIQDLSMYALRNTYSFLPSSIPHGYSSEGRSISLLLRLTGGIVVHLVASRRCREYKKKLPISSWSKGFASDLHQDHKIGWCLTKKRGFWLFSCSFFVLS